MFDLEAVQVEAAQSLAEMAGHAVWSGAKVNLAFRMGHSLPEFDPQAAAGAAGEEAEARRREADVSGNAGPEIALLLLARCG
jgi:hypothetical protein